MSGNSGPNPALLAYMTGPNPPTTEAQFYSFLESHPNIGPPNGSNVHYNAKGEQTIIPPSSGNTDWDQGIQAAVGAGIGTVGLTVGALASVPEIAIDLGVNSAQTFIKSELSDAYQVLLDNARAKEVGTVEGSDLQFNALTGLPVHNAAWDADTAQWNSTHIPAKIESTTNKTGLTVQKPSQPSMSELVMAIPEHVKSVLHSTILTPTDNKTQAKVAYMANLLKRKIEQPDNIDNIYRSSFSSPVAYSHSNGHKHKLHRPHGLKGALEYSILS
jgi:hypothetical protein